jgi:hypothetical protein
VQRRLAGVAHVVHLARLDHEGVAGFQPFRGLAIDRQFDFAFGDLADFVARVGVAA